MQIVPQSSPTADEQVLQKAAHLLAFEISTGALTATGRKLYNLMLWHAQRMRPTPDDSGHKWFRAPIAHLVRGRQLPSASATSRLLRYVREMDSVRVCWRALVASEQKQLDGFDAAPEAAEAPAVETRIFGLFSEVRVEILRGQGWVQWCYPPSVHAMLMQPERWAQLRLDSMVQLSTYAAVALYEICARYRDVPGGLTARHPPEFWIGVLREASDLQPRPWRKIKHELVGPAVQQISERTELDVELVEHLGRGPQARSVVAVQFRVGRKARNGAPELIPPQAEDVTLVMRAAAVGVREQDLDTFVATYGAAAVESAMTALDAQLAEGAPIRHRSAYLRTILANRLSGGVVLPETTAHESATSMTPAAPMQLPARTDAQVSTDRLRAAHERFAELSDAERAAWIARTLQLHATSLPTIRRRLEGGQWESPLVRSLVLETYLSGSDGP
jgi:hypothetical protein